MRAVQKLASSIALVTSVSVGCAGITDEDGVAARARCEKLRDHVVDLRLADATGVDTNAHRVAMLHALGDDFVASCSKLARRQVDCALDARDSAAAAACSSSSRR